MKKVFQTIIDINHGNCLQAVIASLLELELDEVPNFIEDEHWHCLLYNYLKDKGYDCCTITRNYNRTTSDLIKIAKFDNGINGYLKAIVPSQTIEGVSHAVVVDTDLNIVHDPNPNQKALLLMPDDIESIMVVHDMVIGKTGKLFTKEEWNNASQVERDLNTY